MSPSSQHRSDHERLALVSTWQWWAT